MTRSVPRQMQDGQGPATEVHHVAVLERADVLVSAQVEGLAELRPKDPGLVGS
jgi:hypothetical protein